MDVLKGLYVDIDTNDDVNDDINDHDIVLDVSVIENLLKQKILWV